MDFEALFALLLPALADWGLKVLGALVLLVFGRIAAGWFRRITRRALTKSQIDPILVPFLSGFAYWVVIAVIAVAVLNLFGVSPVSLVAVLGAVGLAVGLALKDSLANFASGIMLLIFRPFKVGDFVEAGGASGAVVEVGIFSTVLKSADNVKITLPNSQIFGTKINNYNGFPTRRIDLVVGVSYDDDLSVAISTITSVVTADDRILEDPVPMIAVSNLGDSSIDIVVRPWCKTEDYWSLRFDLTRRLKEELEGAGCSIPYPQRDVHVIQNQGAVA